MTDMRTLSHLLNSKVLSYKTKYLASSIFTDEHNRDFMVVAAVNIQSLLTIRYFAVHSSWKFECGRKLH